MGNIFGSGKLYEPSKDPYASATEVPGTRQPRRKTNLDAWEHPNKTQTSGKRGKKKQSNTGKSSSKKH